MNWDDVNDILFTGTQKQINEIKCPECNGDLKVCYFPAIKSVEIYCQGCGAVIKQHGVSQIPNFAMSMA